METVQLFSLETVILLASSNTRQNVDKSVLTSLFQSLYLCSHLLVAKIASGESATSMERVPFHSLLSGRLSPPDGRKNQRRLKNSKLTSLL
jgi:hypothetical protein